MHWNIKVSRESAGLVIRYRPHLRCQVLMVITVKITVSSDVISCSADTTVVKEYATPIYSELWSSTIPWNVGTHLPNYMAPHAIRQYWMFIEGQVQGQAGRDFSCYKPYYNQTTMCLNFKITFCILFCDSISILDYAVNGTITDDGWPIKQLEQSHQRICLGELTETITKTYLDSQCLSHESISISDYRVLTVTRLVNDELKSSHRKCSRRDLNKVPSKHKYKVLSFQFMHFSYSVDP